MIEVGEYPLKPASADQGNWEWVQEIANKFKGFTSDYGTEVAALEAADTALDTRLDLLESRVFMRAYLASPYVITTSWQTIPIGTVDFDPLGTFDTTNHYFVAPFTGYFHINGRSRTDLNNNPQQICVGLLLNGATVQTAGNLETIRGGTGGDPLACVVSDIVKLNAGSTINLINYNGGSNNMNVDSGINETYLSVIGFKS